MLWYLKHTLSLSIHTLLCLLVKSPNQIHLTTFHLALLCSLRGCNLQTMLALVSCLRIQVWKNRISCPSRLKVSSLTSGPVQTVRRPVRYPAVQSSMHPDHRLFWLEGKNLEEFWHLHPSGIEFSGNLPIITPLYDMNTMQTHWFLVGQVPLSKIPPQTSPGACHFPQKPGPVNREK